MGQSKQEPRTGFDGLSALASTISAEPSITCDTSANASNAAARCDPPPPHQAVPKGPGFWTGSRKTWALAITGFGLVVYLNSGPQRSTPVPRPPSTSASPSTPSPAPPLTISPTITPPVGDNRILSVGEIKYCLAERIRLEAMQTIVNDRSHVEVRNFNLRIDDFNSRCSNYRYRQSDMEKAKYEVEINRLTLRSQAISQVNSWR